MVELQTFRVNFSPRFFLGKCFQFDDRALFFTGNSQRPLKIDGLEDDSFPFGGNLDLYFPEKIYESKGLLRVRSDEPRVRSSSSWRSLGDSPWILKNHLPIQLMEEIGLTSFSYHLQLFLYIPGGFKTDF